LIGPAVAVAAVGLAVGAVFLPQPTAQVVAAAQPGLALGVAVLVGLVGWKWYRKWRAEVLPTFSRTLPPQESSRANRSSSGGSVVPFEARPSGS
jgi:hypothetical protein